MTREEAIKILEYPVKKWSMEWDEREDGLSYYEALDMAISALRQQETVINRNEPLTLDDLRQMEGQPVYIVENTEYWAIVNSFDQAGVYLLSYGNPDDYGYFGFYGKTWLAYRQKPEEGDGMKTKKLINCPQCGRFGFTSTPVSSDYKITVCRGKTCELCHGAGVIEAPMTNADQIRSMTDEELADFLNQWGTSTRAWQKDPGETLHWLQQPAEEDKHENLD